MNLVSWQVPYRNLFALQSHMDFHCFLRTISVHSYGSRASPFPRLSRPTGDVTSASRVPCTFRPWYDYDNIFQILIAPENIVVFIFEKA